MPRGSMRSLTLATASALALMLAGCTGEESIGETANASPSSSSSASDAPSRRAANNAAPDSPTNGVAASPKKVEPLETGQPAPSLTIRDAEGEPFDLNQAIAERPAVLVFYRGSWCPYCMGHLNELKAIQPKLEEMGYQLLAISPDKPEQIAATVKDHGLNYRLLSDAETEAIRAFGLAFDQGSRILPIPAVYIVSKDGTIRFAHSNPDYSERLAPEKIVEAAKRVKDAKGQQSRSSKSRSGS